MTRTCSASHAAPTSEGPAGDTHVSCQWVDSCGFTRCACPRGAVGDKDMLMMSRMCHQWHCTLHMHRKCRRAPLRHLHRPLRDTPLLHPRCQQQQTCSCKAHALSAASHVTPPEPPAPAVAPSAARRATLSCSTAPFGKGMWWQPSRKVLCWLDGQPAASSVCPVRHLQTPGRDL
jgi:hypothetical protein